MYVNVNNHLFYPLKFAAVPNDVSSFKMTCYMRSFLIFFLSICALRGFAGGSAPEKKYPFHKKTDKQVSGIVSNAAGEALEGVSISAKGNAGGVTSGTGGKYSITVAENSILVFSYVGYISQEIPVTGDKLNVVLQKENGALEDVVVTALGIKRNTKSLTYSTQSVNTERLTEAREINIMNSLPGKVAGLSITSSAAGVGGDVRVVLRGNRSINGDSQPLYVVDGVPVSIGIADINPDNIASMNVLKGPNAAAIYGSAAQNGAIIIETKRGTPGIRVGLNETFMAQKTYGFLPFQNVYGQGVNGEYSPNAESSWGPKLDGRMVETWSLDPADAGKQYAFSPNPGNKKDVFQTGYNASTNLTVSMGSERSQALFAYTFTNGRGILPGNNLKRHNISLRFNSKLTDKLVLDSKIEYINQGIDNLITEGGTNLNPFSQVYRMPSNIRTEDVKHYEYTDEAGNKLQNWWNPSSADGENPYWVLNRDINTNGKQRLLLMSSLAYNFTRDLKLQLRTSLDASQTSLEQKWYNGTFNVAPYGMYWVGKGEDKFLQNDFLLSYNHDFNKDWNVKISGGGSASKSRYSQLLSNTGLAMLIPNLFALSNTNQPVTTYNPGARVDVNSLYAFTTIGWKNAVFLDVTGRNDWSSTLPENNRSYFYPSVGLSAVLSDLIPAYPSFISYTKLRGSYAVVGNDAPAYMLFRTANLFAGGNNGFLQLSDVLPNTNLLPEKTISTEFGLDIRFFDNRLGFDITAYRTNTQNQLFTVALPVGSGASSSFTNGGDVQNKGVELVLTASPVRGQDFHWDLSLNYARNRNMVKKISDQRPRVVVPANDSYFKDFVIAQGEPYGQLYGRGWQRNEAGNVIIGSDGLPLLTEGRTVLLANFNPDWMGGLQNTFSYKNFTLSFVIDHRQGGKLVSPSNAVLDGLGVTERTLQGRDGGLIFGKNFFNESTAVTEDNKPNDIPITAERFWTYVGGVNTPIGEAFVVDATSTRLRELTLGYALPLSIVSRLHISDCRISLVGRNLFYIHRASPYADPDIMVGTDKTSEGFQNFIPPSSRYFGLNLKISFK